jgi:hypothetical protein
LTVNFDTFNRANHAPITLHLRRAVTDTQDLVTQTISPAKWTGQPWIKFAFPPLPVHFGDSLTMILESPGGQVGDSVAPRTSAGDAYSVGTLYRRGIPRDFDLAFIAEGQLPDKLQMGFTGEVQIYTNTAALPRVFTVAAPEVLPATEILARSAAPDFNPRRAVLLEQPPPAFAGQATPGKTEAVLAPPKAPGSATITRYRNLSVDVQAEMQQPGWLVLGDENYPGWYVTVDGRPAPLYTAYYILRAVPLPAGTHQVHFYFLPPSVLIGAAISGTALLIALGILYGAYWRSQRRRALVV